MTLKSSTPSSGVVGRTRRVSVIPSPSLQPGSRIADQDPVHLANVNADNWFRTETTIIDGENYWTCTRCRQLVQTPKYAFRRVKNIEFYCCESCYEQNRPAGWFFTLRVFFMNCVFGFCWVGNPQGLWFDGDGVELALSVTFFVIAVSPALEKTRSLQNLTQPCQALSVIASFINVVSIRTMGMLRKKQRRHPRLDFLIEANAALWLGACTGLLIFEGLKYYPGRTWDGQLIGLMVFGCMEL